MTSCRRDPAGRARLLKDEDDEDGDGGGDGVSGDDDDDEEEEDDKLKEGPTRASWFTGDVNMKMIKLVVVMMSS